MFTRYWLTLLCFFSMAAVESVMASDDHRDAIYHAFTLTGDSGEGRDDWRLDSWDADGWIGGDVDKLWFKSEGGRADGHTKVSEVQVLYSRNIATFWDAQMGLRYDSKPESITYLAVGFNGLAPYWFETEAHLFVSDEGDVSFRLREENDFLLTQKLIMKPYLQINVFAQDVRELGVDSGLSDGEMGVQLRYEITRKFAPYLDLHYEKLFGDTANIANKRGDRQTDGVAVLGIQWIF